MAGAMSMHNMTGCRRLEARVGASSWRSAAVLGYPTEYHYDMKHIDDALEGRTDMPDTYEKIAEEAQKLFIDIVQHEDESVDNIKRYQLLDKYVHSNSSLTKVEKSKLRELFVNIRTIKRDPAATVALATVALASVALTTTVSLLVAAVMAYRYRRRNAGFPERVRTSRNRSSGRTP